MTTWTPATMGRKGGKAKVRKGFAAPAVQAKAQETLRARRANPRQ